MLTLLLAQLTQTLAAVEPVDRSKVGPAAMPAQIAPITAPFDVPGFVLRDAVVRVKDNGMVLDGCSGVQFDNVKILTTE